MPGFPYSRKQPHERHDFEREKLVSGYDPVEDGFAYPLPDCSCIVKHPSRLLVEENTERAFRAGRVEMCDTCIAQLLA